MKRAFDTTAVHAARGDFRVLGVHAPPIDLSTTYPIEGLDDATADLDAMLAGERPHTEKIYARLDNPTVSRFERAFAELERADDSVAFGSGMAAITAALLAARQRGTHVVAVRPVYGSTDHLLSCGLLGIDVTWATPSTVGNAIRANTSLVIIETPGNPTCVLVDIADVVRQARGVPVLVDSTFGTPVLQNPIAHGAAMALHSATKYIGGHGDVVAGVVATSNAFARELRVVRVLTGALLHPMAAYLLHRGLQTLPVRVRAAQASAMALAERLSVHECVEDVRYPSLPGCDPRGLLGRQMKGPGAMIAFTVRGGHEAAAAVMRSVMLATPAVSLGACDTLIQHPAGLTHRVVDAIALEEMGITPGMLRVSVGLEDVEDLWQDLDGSLRASVREVEMMGVGAL
jgi:methionine-gamma-lyase